MLMFKIGSKESGEAFIGLIGSIFGIIMLWMAYTALSADFRENILAAFVSVLLAITLIYFVCVWVITYIRTL